MKHPSVQALYDYWNARRGQRAAPERADIDPGAIRHLLADTFIIGLDARAGHPFRIAGTRVCAALGRELKGTPFVDIWNQQSRTAVRDILNAVAHESVGVVIGVRGDNAEGSKLELELLMLPLRQRAGADIRILGALGPAHAPHAFGVSTPGTLSLGSFRYLRPEIRRPELRPALMPAPRPLMSPPGGRIRHGFIVYDGGRV